ncbi:MAG: hypothetical protein ACJA1L_002834, partial [Paracoccaceae bacterium]
VPPPAKLERIAVASGGRSLITGRQIDVACADRFASDAVDHDALASWVGAEATCEAALAAASFALSAGDQQSCTPPRGRTGSRR